MPQEEKTKKPKQKTKRTQNKMVVKKSHFCHHAEWESLTHRHKKLIKNQEEKKTNQDKKRLTEVHAMQMKKSVEWISRISQ